MGPEKRLPLVLFISFVVVLVLQLVTAKEPAAPGDAAGGGEPGQSEPLGEGSVAPAVGAAGGAAGDDESAPDAGPAQPDLESWDRWVEFGEAGEPGHMAVHFDSYGGSVSEIRLGNHFTRVGLTDEETLDRENWVRLVEPVVDGARVYTTFMVLPGPEAAKRFAVDVAAVDWAAEEVENGVRFVHADVGGLTLTKTIRWVPGTYHLDVALEITATDERHVGQRLTLDLVAAVGMGAETDDAQYKEPQVVAALEGKAPKSSAVDPKGAKTYVTLAAADGRPIDYFGCQNKYFAMLARPADETTKGSLGSADKVAVYDARWAAQQPTLKDQRMGWRHVLAKGTLRSTVPAVGDSVTRTLVVFAGPKDASLFEGEDAVYQTLLREDLGFFDGIASLILGFLRFLHGIVGNWGWAIILLTITVRLLLFPLQRKMQTSMARHATKMRRVQPKIDALKEKYAKDPQRLRQEQAKLFQEEGAMPPIGGCLPIFLQIPIFFGLFSALRVAFDLRHQPFIGWIEDLSQPDRLAPLGIHIPLIGEIEWFNLLPILMVVLWIAQQKVMPKPATMNEQQAQMQKIMMWMPIMFGFFLYGYASGLSLYMITTSIFGIVESTVIRKVWPIDDSEQPKKKSRFMARLEELQKQATAMQEAQAKQRAQGQRGPGPRGGKKRR